MRSERFDCQSFGCYDCYDCDDCPLPSPLTIRRERMTRDDSTQPPADEAYAEQLQGDE